MFLHLLSSFSVLTSSSTFLL
ncbi:hypothetical protein ACHAWT_000399 [Skeletonema menzelii]